MKSLTSSLINRQIIQIYEGKGTNQIQRLVMARHLLKSAWSRDLVRRPVVNGPHRIAECDTT